MKEEIKKLYKLSDLSTTIRELQKQIAAVPQQIQELDRELSTFRVDFDQINQQLQGFQKTYREQEVALADSQSVVKEREAKLYMIKTTKEYQAAVTEIAGSRRRHREIENQLLKLLEEMEALEPKVKEQEPTIEVRAREIAEQKAELESSVVGLQQQLEQYRAGWQEKTQGIPSDLLSRFERSTQFHVDAIAFLTGNTCEGCFMKIPPQMVIEVMRMENLHSCPNCQRLLFIKEAVEDEGIEPPTA